ncbi:MAG: porin family protein [Hyphomicrobiales bacterium]|nr:porin family protein [Hyphomicrobiales bacterium]
MKKFLISGAAALVLMNTGAVSAADLPARKGVVSAPIVYAPAFTWTGFYAGLNGGYGFGSFTGTASPLLRDPSGFVGGGQLGYNYQINQFVVGVEGDLQYVDAKANGRGGLSYGRLDYFGTIRARGGVAFDRALIYATAGYAFGKATAATAVLADSNMHNGYAVGAGVEYAITNNWSAKLEYLYTSFEKKTYLAPGTTAGLDFSTVRGGVTYRF